VAHEDRRARRHVADDLEQVVGVALEARILRGVVGIEVRLAGAHQVEGHHLVAVREPWRHESPHVLVAPESVGEDDGRRSGALDPDVVSMVDVHGRLRAA